MYKELKQEAYLANMEIPVRNLAIYTWGNVSAFDKDAGVFAIKPSGVPYDELTADQMVIIDLEGKIIDGSLNPSSDTPTHLELYKWFVETKRDVRGITHTHSPIASSWAQACRSIPIFGTTHADHGFYPIPCTQILTEEAVKREYEKETGTLIIETLINPKKAYPVPSIIGQTSRGAFFEESLNPEECQMILVGGHGPFTWGKDASKSVYNACVLEEVAKMALTTIKINNEIEALPDYVIDKHYQRKHGENAYYGQK